MFEQVNTPQVLWGQAEQINQMSAALYAKIKKLQKECQHAWEKVMEYDPNFSPRADGRDRGGDVIKEFHCLTFKARKPLKGFPWQVCRKCGGRMEYDHRELYGMDRVHIHKCGSCGHEYDTT